MGEREGGMTCSKGPPTGIRTGVGCVYGMRSNHSTTCTPQSVTFICDICCSHLVLKCVLVIWTQLDSRDTSLFTHVSLRCPADHFLPPSLFLESQRGPVWSHDISLLPNRFQEMFQELVLTIQMIEICQTIKVTTTSCYDDEFSCYVLVGEG